MRLSQGAVWLHKETSHRKHDKEGAMLMAHTTTHGCRNRQNYHCKKLEGKLRTRAVPLSSEIQRLLTLCQKANRETAPHTISIHQGNPASKADTHSSLQVWENETCIYYEPRGVHAHSVVSDSLRPYGCSPQAPLSLGFSRQVYWSGPPFSPLGDFAWASGKTSQRRTN